MLYGYVKCNPRACHHDTLHQVHHSQRPDSLRRLAKEQSHRPPDFLSVNGCYGDVKGKHRGSLRRRRILFAGFVARMEGTRLPECVMFGDLAGGGRTA